MPDGELLLAHQSRAALHPPLLLATPEMVELGRRALMALRSPTGLLSAPSTVDAGADLQPALGLLPGRLVHPDQVVALWQQITARSETADPAAMGALGDLIGDPALLALAGLSRMAALDALGDPVVRHQAVVDLHLSTPALIALRAGTTVGRLRETLDELLVGEAERTRDRGLVLALQRSTSASVAARADLVEGRTLLATLEDLRRLPEQTPHAGPLLEAAAEARRALDAWLARMTMATPGEPAASAAPAPPAAGTDLSTTVADLRTRAAEASRQIQLALGQRVLHDLRALHTRPVTHLPTWEVRRDRALGNARYWLHDVPSGAAWALNIVADVRRAVDLTIAEQGAWATRSALAVRRAHARTVSALEWWEAIGIMSALPVVVGLVLLRINALAPAVGAVASLTMFAMAQSHRKLLRRPGAWSDFYVDPPGPGAP